MSYWLIKEHENTADSPFGKGGFLDKSILHKISPFPSLPKRGIFGSMKT